ncbi:MAG: GyrI-like domain-containing protein [bacterium]
MPVPSDYRVSIEQAQPRGIAAVSARMPIRQVPARFREFLDQVYSASRAGAVRGDGQNIFVYRDTSGPDTEIEFGVGVSAPFSSVGAVHYSELPVGEAATTTHWGDYAGLRDAHAAVDAWCRANGRETTGTRWEVYGHWTEDPAHRRTDVHHLLRAVA